MLIQSMSLSNEPLILTSPFQQTSTQFFSPPKKNPKDLEQSCIDIDETDFDPKTVNPNFQAKDVLENT